MNVPHLVYKGMTRESCLYYARWIADTKTWRNFPCYTATFKSIFFEHFSWEFGHRMDYV